MAISIIAPAAGDVPFHSLRTDTLPALIRAATAGDLLVLFGSNRGGRPAEAGTIIVTTDSNISASDPTGVPLPGGAVDDNGDPVDGVYKPHNRRYLYLYYLPITSTELNGSGEVQIGVTFQNGGNDRISMYAYLLRGSTGIDTTALVTGMAVANDTANFIDGSDQIVWGTGASFTNWSSTIYDGAVSVLAYGHAFVNDWDTMATRPSGWSQCLHEDGSLVDNLIGNRASISSVYQEFANFSAADTAIDNTALTWAHDGSGSNDRMAALWIALKETSGGTTQTLLADASGTGTTTVALDATQDQTLVASASGTGTVTATITSATEVTLLADGTGTGTTTTVISTGQDRTLVIAGSGTGTTTTVFDATAQRTLQADGSGIGTATTGISSTQNRTLQADGSATGTTATVLDATQDRTLQADGIGTGITTAAITAVQDRTLTISGSGTGTTAATISSDQDRTLLASSSGTGTTTATITVSSDVTLSGTPSGTGTASTIASRDASLLAYGSATGTTTTVLDATQNRTLAAEATGTGSTTAAITSTSDVTLSATPTGTGTATVALVSSQTRSLSVDSSGSGSTATSLTASQDRSLTASVSGSGSSTTELSTAGQTILGGTISGSGTTTTSISRTIGLLGDGTASGTATATISTGQDVTLTAISVGSGSATLSVTVTGAQLSLTLSATAQGSGTSTISRTASIESAPVGASEVTAGIDLGLVVSLAATGKGSTTATIVTAESNYLMKQGGRSLVKLTLLTEEITYYPGGDLTAGKTIRAVVDRMEPEVQEYAQDLGSLTVDVNLWIATDATLGISTVQSGKDLADVVVTEGQAAERVRIVDVIDYDPGMVHLLGVR
jgi:hypothetical protein